MRALANGASLLTGARPGGAGKSTLLGAILGLLPPDVRIVTVDGPEDIQQGLAQPADEPACYLAHEIGAGHWYGYIWGQDVADFFSLVDGRRRIASCLHADTLEELTGILRSPPLRVREAALERVDLILFIRVVAGGRRRVVSFWEADWGGGHREVFRWNAATDTFDTTGGLHKPPFPPWTGPRAVSSSVSFTSKAVLQCVRTAQEMAKMFPPLIPPLIQKTCIWSKHRQSEMQT